MTQPSLLDAPVPQSSRIDPDSKLARVHALFVQKKGQWIDSEELAKAGGRCAWRTRCSECRTLLGMTIENRLRKVRTLDGDFVISEYRYAGKGQQEP